MIILLISFVFFVKSITTKNPRKEGFLNGGCGWDRTSDPYDVKMSLSLENIDL